MLLIKNLTVSADNKEILHNTSIHFDVNKIYAIMGVNGSGKSSLAKTIMGTPTFTITSGELLLNNQNINKLPPNERAQKGIFLAQQAPLAISGVTVTQLLRSAISRDKMDSKKLLQEITNISKKLEISKNMLYNTS